MSRMMIHGKPWILVGDTTTHGGVVITGSETTKEEGIPIARKGDKVTCPRCKPHIFVIAEGVENSLDHGIPIAVEGHETTCGAKLIARAKSHDGEELGSVGVPVPVPVSSSWAAGDGAGTMKKEPDYTISLKNGGNRILTPLEIPDYKPGNTQNSERIAFEITNRGGSADSVVLEVLDGDKVIYSEQSTVVFSLGGTHDWYWDGYDTNDVLDTSVLKSKNLKVRLTATQGGKQQVREIPLKNKAEEVDWLDAKVNRNTNVNEVEITLRPSFSDGQVEGKDLTGQIIPPSYKQRLVLAKQGIEHYWSRDGSRLNSIGTSVNTAKGAFKVKVKVDLDGEPKSGNFRLIVLFDLNPGMLERSTSIWPVRKIYHHADYFANPNDHFKKTAAHELGHLIIENYRDKGSLIPSHSWKHKGTSTIWQRELPNNPYPLAGEIDVMQYYSNYPKTQVEEQDYFDRSVASDQDVKGLLWLARVKFR